MIGKTAWAIAITITASAIQPLALIQSPRNRASLKAVSCRVVSAISPLVQRGALQHEAGKLQREEHHEQRNGGGITDVKEPERHLVEIEAQGFGSAGWAAYRQDEDLIEQAESVHDAQQQRHDDHRLQERQGEITELLEG